MSLNSTYNLIKKYIPYPAVYSLNIIPKTATTFLPPLAAIKLANTPPDISLKTPTEHEFSIPQVPRTPNVPDFDPIPPEKPSDPSPLAPYPTPEFPGPPKPDPEIQPPGPDMPTPEFPGPPKPDPKIQPPGPDMPVPPNTPGGPEVVPPRTPEWMPPDPATSGATRNSIALCLIIDISIYTTL